MSKMSKLNVKFLKDNFENILLINFFKICKYNLAKILSKNNKNFRLNF